MEERIISPIEREEDTFEKSLRPQFFSEYIGQDKVKNELGIYIQAAKQREESLDHVLLYGPPGLGKTTMAMVIANEMQVSVRTTSGPAIEKPGDLVAILNELDPGDVLFIDEIHRLPKVVEEMLYSAMEDFYIDIMVGQGTSAHPVHFPLPPFTLVGATTRAGMLSAPLRDRFGIISHMEYYTEADLQEIICRSAAIFSTEIVEEGALEIARRSRGTPRIANRLLKRVRDFADVNGDGIIDRPTAEKALELLEIDNMGLDPGDRNLLTQMFDNYGENTVGLNTIAALTGDESTTIEDFYEPYLLQIGFIERTPRGRRLTKKAINHLKTN